MPVDSGARDGEMRRRAQERLRRVEEIRTAGRLFEAGFTMRHIADTLHCPVPRAQRMVHAAGSYGSEPSPEEIILRAAVDDTDRNKLIRTLSECRFTFRAYAPAPFEGAQGGTWDQVRTAHAGGLLTTEEFQRVRAAVQPPPEAAAKRADDA